MYLPDYRKNVGFFTRPKTAAKKPTKNQHEQEKTCSGEELEGIRGKRRANS